MFDDEELAAATRMIAGGVAPTGAKSRRQMQNRLYALRAMDGLGLLEDDKLRRALADRPALSWLVSEEGARWAILAEAGSHNKGFLGFRYCRKVGPRVPAQDQGGRSGDPAFQNREKQSAGHP